jgi:hypothetical protein
MKGLCESCLKEEERKLNEGEGRSVYMQKLTTFSIWEPETNVALGIGGGAGVCTCIHIRVNTQDFWENKFLYM